jgi:hypothetical protein
VAATQGIFDALLVVGLVFLPLGLMALGVAMFGTPAFGKGLGGLSVALGVVGILSASTLLVHISPVGAVGILGLIAFHFVTGWKTYNL